MYNLQEKQSIAEEPQSVPVVQDPPKYSSIQTKRPNSAKKCDIDPHCESEKKVSLSR